MRAVSATAVLLLAAALVADAHLCLTYPMQRGPTPRLFPGDPACFNRVASCGSLPRGAPTGKFIVGTLATLNFQQNLNHWYPENPGHFDLAVSYDDEATWLPLGNVISDFPANNMNTQTDFSAPVTFPHAGNAIVRARYVSNNVNEVDPADNTQAIFYSCADVAITDTNGTVPTAAFSAPVVAEQQPKKNKTTSAEVARPDGISCTAPNAFVAEGITRAFGGSTVLHHTIHYDVSAGWMRWNRNDTLLGGTYDMTDLWNLTLASAGYTPQFIMGLTGPNTCSMYGGDAFYPWSFGPTNGMEHLYNETRRDGSIKATFVIPTADFEFSAIFETATSPSCLPHLIRHGVLETELVARTVASIDPEVFAVPAICAPKTSMPEGGCKGPQHSSRRA